MQSKEMFRFKRVRNNSKLFMAMTSLNQVEFFKLLPKFREAWDDYKQRSGNKGRPSQFFCIEDMLVFILYYLKCYPLQEVFAYIFGMSQGDANYWIHLLASVLRDALDRGGNLPARNATELKELLDKELESRKTESLNTDDEASSKEKVLEVGIDGTERRIVRPTDDEVQQEFYSGKTKAHTVKSVIIGDLDSRKVYGLSDTSEGKKSDKLICDEAKYEFPEGTNAFQDKGFQGYHPPGATVYQPTKKPRNGELTKEQTEINSIISSCRVVIEHIISGVKRLRVVKDVFRNTKDNFDDLVMELACGLHNFREECRAPC